MTSPDAATDPLGLVGTTIVNKYAVEAVVGEGGFAIVYRANHVLWKRPVAVKVFKALSEVSESQRAKLLEDFIQEGALLAELSERSTAIVQARDVGMLTLPRGEHVPYMVLEWLEGMTLDALIQNERVLQKTPRTIDQAVRLLEPVAEALELAHRKNIAHRDVKPANVFVLSQQSSEESGGGVKLLDFGIAKVVQDAQKMGFAKTAGHITSFTPLYGAPEQFDRSKGATGPWTDVFALALVVTEVISGQEPMMGDTLVQLAYASTDPNRRPTPRSLGVAVSDAVEAVFLKAVAVRPEDRYQSAGPFWSALRSALSLGRSSGPTALFDEANAPVSGPRSSARIPAVGGGSLPAITGAPASTMNVAPPKSRVPLAVGAVAIAAALGIVAFFATNAKKGEQNNPVASASASATSSPPPSASASAAPPTKECPKGMVAVPGGEFFMGSDERDAFDFEKPPHKVKLSAYCLDEFEVTVAQYKKCSDRGGCLRAGKENVWPKIKAAQAAIYNPLCNTNDPTKADHPINCVDWNQAEKFCAEERGGRLPTEAEWEFAARGTDGRIYPWGDDPPGPLLLNACGTECLAWQKAHRDPDLEIGPKMYDADDSFPNTAPVGSFPKGKSRYGAQDMVGNVWEWVADWYADYGAASSTDPKGPAQGSDRVIRGGSWNGTTPSWVRPSFRFHAAPSARSYGFGFRCAKSL